MSVKTASLVEDSIACKELDVGQDETVAGKTGRNAMFQTKVRAKVGGWYNASKSELIFETGGEVTGAASAHNCELYLPDKALPGGEYQVLELNLQSPTSTVSHGNLAMPISFIKFKLSGASKTTLEDSPNMVLFQIDGFDEAATSCVDLAAAPGAVDGNIRIAINGADWFIPIASAGA